MMRSRLITTLLVLLALLPRPGRAQDSTIPVAVISLVWGVVTVKHQGADYQPARWLEPILPGDFVKTAGPGSRLLITFFNDNHQEVMETDTEANVGPTTLTSSNGKPIRKDGPRNPFGAGGVENPFVYTRKLVTGDFAGADSAGAIDRENIFLKAAVNSAAPPSFTWMPQSGVKQYNIQVLAPSLQFTWNKTVAAPRCKMSMDESNALNKGSVYQWQVTAPDNSPVVAAYPFKFLSLPLEKWLKEQRSDFDGKRKRKQLQRCDYTDYLLVCSQLTRIDDALALCQEMAGMDGQNPQVFRALARVYLYKGCPAHAKQAYDREIQLGGYDPLGL